METSLRVFLVAIMVIAAFFVGATVGQRSGDGGIGSIFDSSGSAELSSEAIDVINESYFRNVDDEKLEDASVKGMVAELSDTFKDRFSHYFSPDAFFHQGRALVLCKEQEDQPQDDSKQCVVDIVGVFSE